MVFCLHYTLFSQHQKIGKISCRKINLFGKLHGYLHKKLLNLTLPVPCCCFVSLKINIFFHTSILTKNSIPLNRSSYLECYLFLTTKKTFQSMSTSSNRYNLPQGGHRDPNFACPHRIIFSIRTMSLKKLVSSVSICRRVSLSVPFYFFHQRKDKFFKDLNSIWTKHFVYFSTYRIYY